MIRGLRAYPRQSIPIQYSVCFAGVLRQDFIHFALRQFGCEAHRALVDNHYAVITLHVSHLPSFACVFSVNYSGRGLFNTTYWETFPLGLDYWRSFDHFLQNGFPYFDHLGRQLRIFPLHQLKQESLLVLVRPFDFLVTFAMASHGNGY